MNMTNISRWIGVAAACGATVLSVEAQTPTVTLTPNVISNNFVGMISLTISNLSPGQTVRVEKFKDVNANGVVDAADLLVQRYSVTDGVQPYVGGIANLNVPGDLDETADRQINVAFMYPAINATLDHIAGQFVFRVSDPAGVFAPITAALRVDAAGWTQGVTGTARVYGSETVIANAIVVMVPQDGGGYGAMAGADGSFSIGAPPGNYALMAFSAGFFGNMMAAQVSVGSNEWVNLDVPAVAASRVLAGRVTDQNSGQGLAGLFVEGESTNGYFSMTFTDTDGNYALPVIPDQWKVKVNVESGLVEAGYVHTGNGLQTYVNSGNVSNLNFQFPQANAVVWGKVLDNQSNAVPGLVLRGDNSGMESAAVSRPGVGRYVMGVLGGTWNVSPDNSQLAAQGLMGQSVQVTVGAGGSVRTNLMVLRTTAHIRGRYVDNLGMPLGNAMIVINQVNTNGSFIPMNLYPQTQGDGTFDIGLFAGTWNLQLECSSAQSFNVVSPNTRLTLVDGVDQNNVILTAPHVTGYIQVQVTDRNGNPVSANVFASSLPSGGYNSCTGNNSSYVQLPVFNGTWVVGLSSDIMAQGYDLPPNQTVTVAGNTPSVTFALYSLGQTPAQLSQPALVNGHFQFNVSGSQSRSYRVEATATPWNPGSWVGLSTNTPYGGSFLFWDGNVSASARFYRAVLLP